MSVPFQRVSSAVLNKAIEDSLFDYLQRLLSERGLGHCMKVSDLDSGIIVPLCQKLRSASPQPQVFVLTHETANADSWAVTSSKLVELRNPNPDGTLRPPLLVFVPGELKTSSEDSFGIATFEEISLAHVYGTITSNLLQALGDDLSAPVKEVLVYIQRDGWKWRDARSVVRFLLSIITNGKDHEVVGASLFELGLVPDFKLLDTPAAAPARISRNITCVNTLTNSPKSERGRVMDLGLKDPDFKRKLGDFLIEQGLEDPRNWTAQIVADKRNWDLSFDKWVFETAAAETQKVCVEVLDLDLPVVEPATQDPKLKPLINQQVLTVGTGGLRKFSVKFKVSPHPTQVQGLDHFKIQVVSKTTGPIGLIKKKSVWNTKRQEASVSVSNLTKVDWEEGWHYVRITAHNENGDPIPLVDTVGNPLPWDSGTGPDDTRRINESDEFYVFKGQDIDIEPTQRAVPRYPSLMHALLDKQFSGLCDQRSSDEVLITKVAWLRDEAAPELKGQDIIEVKLGREGTCHVPVSTKLKELEQKILASPRGPISWRLPIQMGVARDAVNDLCRWPEGELVEAFLASRTAYFAALSAKDSGMVSQGADFRQLDALVCDYAEHYLKLVQSFSRRAETAQGLSQAKALEDLQTVLCLDLVKVDHLSHRGHRSLSVLVGPTHPLRSLWLVAWAALSRHWLTQAKLAPKEFIASTRSSLLEQLSLVNFPTVLPVDQGYLLLAVDNVHPFWTLYAPSNEANPRGLIAEVCTALNLDEPNIGSFALNGQYLAKKIRRYLVQHPYTSTIVINAFNAGRGKLLAETLLDLQADPDFADLRYNIRLFVPDPDAPGVGDDLSALLSPTGQTIAEEADAFNQPTGSHLSPKLSLALLSTADFKATPADFSAHISLLLDTFPPQEVSAEPADFKARVAPVHGLLQDFSIHYLENSDTICWARSPRHGNARPIQDSEELPALLSKLAEVLSNAAASIATNQAGLSLLPTSRLALSADDRALLHQVHETSDWVFTVDRNMGIEFFDRAETSQKPEYLIDHSPELTSNAGRRVMITSRSLTEIETMMARVLHEHGFPGEARRGSSVLRQLRALSGRVALKLISSPTQRSEALGLALAKMYLEHQEVLQNQIVVPLDDHLELYRECEGGYSELGDEISLKRTDLALFDLDAARRTITCNLVEVKCYKQLGSIGAYNQLKLSIAEQIQQSEMVIQYHFDPARTPKDRADRPLKNQQLANLLEFYADRAMRLGLLSQEAYDESIFLLRTLDEGYVFQFTRSGLIFDFEKTGTDQASDEAGIEYHRIGFDLISALVTSLPERRDDASSLGAVLTGALEPEPQPPAPTAPHGTTSVPRLTKAVFLSEKRTRTVFWDHLQTKSTDSDTTTDDGGAQAVVSPPPPAPVPPAPAPARPAEPPPTSPSPRPDPVATPPTPVEPPPMPALPPAPGADTCTPYDVMLGVSADSPQFGLLGQVHARRVALDLNQTHTISLFGVQGGGKSYTLGSIIEMASMRIAGINQLPCPLATVVFHYSSTQDYEPEFTTMNRPNPDRATNETLLKDYSAKPAGLGDICLLAPRDKVDIRKEQYPHIAVHPLTFASSELQASHWKFLMGAVGSQAIYIRQLNQLMRSMRQDLTLQGLRDAVDHCPMPDNLKSLATNRLNLAAEYIDDSSRLCDLIRPGRLVIVDLRDEFIEKDEALGLFVVLLQIFADAKYQGQKFNKLVVFDEAHKYIESPDLVDGLISVVREMRHKGTSVLVASQDPPSVPIALIELSSQIILHRFNSPAWLKHIQRANAALSGLTADKMAHLSAGEAYVWSSKASDLSFSRDAIKVTCRPRVTAHGGATKTAVEQDHQ